VLELEIVNGNWRFRRFSEDLLIAIALAESIGVLIQPKVIADQAGLTYKRGWVGEAVRMLQTNGFVNASFSIGDPDGVAASITGSGWEEAERLADRLGESVEAPSYVEVEERAGGVWADSGDG
jgi:hypothetical protein